jgi:hypothetical protein
LFTIRTGASIRSDRRLFLDGIAGALIELGVLVTPSPSARYQVSPLLRFDLYGSSPSEARFVMGADAVLAASYKWRPYRATNYYTTGNIAWMSVYRRASGGSQIAGAPGVGLGVGIEQTFPSDRRVTFEVEYTHAFFAIERRRLNEYVYEPARPGGLHLTLGYVFGR